jgi:outer membrane protein TolC
MNALTPLALALAFAQAPAQPPTTPPAPPAAPPQQTAPAPQPGAEQPPATTALPEPQAAGPVITLGEALDAAGAKNYDIKTLEAQLRESNELSWQAWSGYLPQVTLSGSYTRNQYSASIPFPIYQAVRRRDPTAPSGSPNNPSDPNVVSGQTVPGLPGSADILATVNENISVQKQDALAGQAQITQLLIAPQLWYGIKAANRAETVAALSIDNGRREILFGVARAYYGVASLKQAYLVSLRLLEIAQRAERDARVRYQAGSVPKVNLIRAEIDRARAEQDVKRALNSYLSAKVALAVLLARDTAFEVTDPPEPPLPADTSGLEEQALRDRPDVRAAREQIGVARATQKSAVAGYFPVLSAFGNYTVLNSGGFTGADKFWAVGLQAQWKIFDGGLRESTIRQDNARIAEAEASASSTELRARQEVKQALLELDSARANAVKAKEQRDLAAENQRLVDVAYRAGTATAVEQADATTALRNAEIALLTENLNAQLAAVQVLKSAGAFDPGKRQ